MASRKQIAAALLAQLTAGNQFPKFGRRLTSPDTAAAPGAPALYLLKPTENHEHTDRGTPGVRTMDFLVVIYTAIDPADKTAIPADLIDDLLDVIDAALKPVGADAVRGNRQTLGNLVSDCRIDGTAEIAAGDVIGKGMAVVPIKVMLP